VTLKSIFSNYSSIFLGRQNDEDNDDRYATPNIRGSRGKTFSILRTIVPKFFFLETPSREQWDDDDSDRRGSQWEYPTPKDSYNRRRQRDTDYYNR
jgi:hypothetical protein